MEPSPVRHVLSFGGGINTVALMILLVNEEAPLDEVVFADTGGEVPETYKAVRDARAYLRQAGVKFTTVRARPKGRNLFETAEARRVIPSVKWRWSTRDFKVIPIHRHYRASGAHTMQYVGIAYDEIHRMKDSRVDFITNLYPLVDRKLGRQDCVDIIKDAGFPMPVKSGCFFCPFNSITRWRWLLETHPKLFERSIQLEEGSKHFPRQRLTDQVYRHRAVVTLRELRDKLRNGEMTKVVEPEMACGAECMT